MPAVPEPALLAVVAALAAVGGRPALPAEAADWLAPAEPCAIGALTPAVAGLALGLPAVPLLAALDWLLGIPALPEV
jgi:hypothetical protein